MRLILYEVNSKIYCSHQRDWMLRNSKNFVNCPETSLYFFLTLSGWVFKDYLITCWKKMVFNVG